MLVLITYDVNTSEAQVRRDHLGGSHPKSAWFSCIKKEQNALTGGILCKSI